MQTSNDNTPTHSNASSFCCICIFSALYEPHVGGVETYTKGIANALVKKGHRVIVVTNNTDNALEQESANGIEVVRLPCSTADSRYLRSVLLAMRFGNGSILKLSTMLW